MRTRQGSGVDGSGLDSQIYNKGGSMGRFKGNKGPVFFGLEYDHDDIPNAIVIPSRRGGKIVKWVQSYKPVDIVRPDGRRVRRERTGVVCPLGFRLRKDEIQAAMKEHKTTNWQDGKFFVVMIHQRAKFEHSDTVAMKKAALKKEMDDVKRDLDARKQELEREKRDGTDPAESAGVSHEHTEAPAEEIRSVLPGGATVVDKRRSISSGASEKPSV